MLDYQKFKTTLVKGFDKDEVLAYIQKMEDEGYAKDAEYVKALKAKDVRIDELKKRLALKEEQKERLENEIEQKYKKYIDQYDRIGRLVFEAELKADTILEEARKKADQIVADAQTKADQILADAEEKADFRAADVEKEVNEKLAEGKKKYLAVQEEMNGIVELINQAQRRFMQSYKEVHHIVQNIPDSLSDIDEDLAEDFAEDFADLEELEDFEGADALKESEASEAAAEETDAFDMGRVDEDEFELEDVEDVK